MIKVETIMEICDNVGVRYGRCIRHLGGLKKQTSKVGNLIVLSINKKHVVDLEKVTKKVYLGLIVNTKKSVRRADGTYTAFMANKVVLVNESRELLGTRFDCAVLEEFRESSYSKLLMFSKSVI